MATADQTERRRDDHDAYRARCEVLAGAAGILNATHGRLVDVAIECLAEGDHVGPGLVSFAQFLAWRTGVSLATARSVERIARRAHELPTLVAALRAGEISLDQAAVVARHVPARFEASATTVAKVATVEQLRATLPAYRERSGPTKRRPGVSVHRDDDGWGRLRGELPPDQAEAVERALDAMREDLWRQRKADAKALAAETGEPEAKVPSPSTADALAAMAETACQAGEAAHPGTQRYLISYHLQATPDGRLLLVDAHGMVVGEPERRRILCDHQFEAVTHDATGTPLSVGRTTRHINRKLRRAILHRDRGRCTVPGCATRHGLEIHHIWHWEDGGPTDTGNLTTLCHRHHRSHHHGQLHIAGNADLPAGTEGGLQFGPAGEPLPATGTPTPIAPAAAPTPTRPGTLDPRLGHLRHELRTRLDVTAPDRASTPTGERLDRSGFHLAEQPGPPDEPDEPDGPGGRRRPRHHLPPAGRTTPHGPPDAHAPPAA